jgi:hypothetical protein
MDKRKLDFYASNSHFLDHMLPIWELLQEEYKGIFYIESNMKDYAKILGIQAKVGRPTDNIALVSSWGDYRKTRGDVIFMEHGIGNTYSNNNPSYAGSPGKDRAVMFLNQHDIVQQKNLKTYPNAVNVIIGTPKMDKVQVRHIEGNIVCLSFHWDCTVVPETRSAFAYYKPIINKLSRSKKYKLIMHAHPHINGTWQQQFKNLGVEFYENFADVLRIADLYAVDNSSTMYEFAAAGRPVLALNCPFYRKNVHHGIRFWDYLPGDQVEHYLALPEMIEYTFKHPHQWDDRRNKVVEQLYPYRGHAAQVAVEEITKYLDGWYIKDE